MRVGRDVCLFFFEGEEGIRDDLVTGVQTCALPIAALELAVERDDPRIEEWQDLGEERAGDMLHRGEPEVAVEQAPPGDAAGGTPVRSRLHVDVERQAPFMRLSRELAAAGRIWRLV